MAAWVLWLPVAFFSTNNQERTRSKSHVSSTLMVIGEASQLPARDALCVNELNGVARESFYHHCPLGYWPWDTKERSETRSSTMVHFSLSDSRCPLEWPIPIIPPLPDVRQLITRIHRKFIDATRLSTAALRRSCDTCTM